jgi:uncharacterized protein with WD repeat
VHTRFAAPRHRRSGGSGDIQYFAAAHLDLVKIWMMDRGKLMCQLSGSHAYDMAFSPENAVLAVACDQEIKFVQ